MRCGGLLNAQLAGALARLGHTDTLVVCDAGLPIPHGPETVDLAFQFGIPAFPRADHNLLAEALSPEGS
jgi:D-ribose pyranase